MPFSGGPMLHQPINKQYACGLVSVSSDDLSDEAFWAEIAHAREGSEIGFAIFYYSSSSFLPEDICESIERRCPGLEYAACSAAGEITPEGLSESSVLAILFPKPAFTVHPVSIGDLAEHGVDVVGNLARDARLEFLKRIGDDNERNCFAICLLDGLSYAEEAMTASIHWGLEGIPLLGGSASDSFHFNQTNVILNGQFQTNGAVLLLVHTELRFQVFKTDNFVPTEHKLIVTKSDPEKRIVYELNAAPAAREYSQTIGLDPENLSPLSFASFPLVIRVGGEHYCRSIQKVNEDGSLSFFCAVDDGIVLTVSKPIGMVRSTKAAFDALRSEFGQFDAVLGFDCTLRMVDAQNRQVKHRIAEIYRENNVVGFNTFGEQYNSMHLNQTFTGIAFARQSGA